MKSSIYVVKRLVWLVLLCISIGARADNTVNVSVSPAQAAPGGEVTVSISLENSDAVTSLQVSIPLDEELTLVNCSGVLGDRCNDDDHSLTVGVNGGVLQVFVYSTSMTAIPGNSGEVASFKLKSGNEPKTISLTPSKTVLTDASGDPLACNAQSGTMTILCAKAEFSSMEVDFGRVPIRDTYTKTVTVRNVGNADLEITSLLFSDVNVFSTTTELPLTVSPGASKSLNITYAPVERGNIERSLKVNSNSVSRQNTIKLKAQPFAVNELHIQPAAGISDEEVTVSMTMNNMDDIIGYQVEFTLPEQLEYVKNSFALSDRKQDHAPVVSINGNVLTIIVYSNNNYPLTGDDGEIGSFRVKLVGRNGVTLTPSKTVLSATIDNSVENVASAVYGGMITISSPRIYTSNTLKFGAVSVTENAEKTLIVRNQGNAPLTISRVVFGTDGFSIKEELPTVIAQGGNKSLTVVCSSLEQKPFETKMYIYSNDPDQRMQEVTVTGSRFAPNYLTVSTPDVPSNEYPAIGIYTSNYDAITGLQFDLTYPAAYEPYDNNYTVTSRAADMTVTSRLIGDHKLRCFCYFLSEGTIAAGDGKVFDLLLRPSGDIVPGTSYQVSVENIKMSTADMADKYAGKNTDCTFTTLEPVVFTKGDANGDGEVTMTDVVVTMAYILDDTFGKFIFEAADVNDDGIVTITDAVAIMDIVRNNQ